MQIPTQAARPASHIASQSLQHPAIIGVHLRTPFTPAAALSGVPEITDTEEVTGSNPVSPTSNIPSQMSFRGFPSHAVQPISNQRAGWSGAHDQLNGRPY
jgi:hypothetical protein